MDSNVVDRRCRCNNSRDSSRVRIVSSVSWCHGMYRKSVPIFPIFPCLLLESHSLLYSSSYLSSSMETAHQLHHHHHHHQRSWCPAQEAALVPCIEPTFPNSSSDKIIMKERESRCSFFFSCMYLGLQYNRANKAPKCETLIHVTVVSSHFHFGARLLSRSFLETALCVKTRETVYSYVT